MNETETAHVFGLHLQIVKIVSFLEQVRHTYLSIYFLELLYSVIVPIWDVFATLHVRPIKKRTKKDHRDY